MKQQTLDQVRAPHLANVTGVVLAASRLGRVKTAEERTALFHRVERMKPEEVQALRSSSTSVIRWRSAPA